MSNIRFNNSLINWDSLRHDVMNFQVNHALNLKDNYLCIKSVTNNKMENTIIMLNSE